MKGAEYRFYEGSAIVRARGRRVFLEHDGVVLAQLGEIWPDPLDMGWWWSIGVEDPVARRSQSPARWIALERLGRTVAKRVGWSLALIVS